LKRRKAETAISKNSKASYAESVKGWNQTSVIRMSLKCENRFAQRLKYFKSKQSSF